MMSDDPLFDKAVAVVLEHEGGLSDDPRDAGGLTNFGFALNENPDMTAAQIRSMTREQAIARYLTKWWQPNAWKELPETVAIKAFDLAVDIGPDQANQALQRAVRAASGRILAEDGDLGPVTIAACQACQEPVLLAAFKEALASHYRELVAVRPMQRKFLTGWLSRAYS